MSTDHHHHHQHSDNNNNHHHTTTTPSFMNSNNADTSILRAWFDSRWSQLSQSDRTRLLSVMAGGLVTGALTGLKGLLAVAGIFVLALPQHERDRLDPMVISVGLGSGVVGSSFGLSGVLLLSVFGSYLSTQKPTVESFPQFFELWFKQEFYPKLQHKLQSELDDRRHRSTSIFTQVTDTINSLFIEFTKKLQETMAWETVRHRVLPAAVFKDNFIFRTCVIDMGTPTTPCLFTFWGINNRWMLAPYLRLDFEGVSILKLLESS
jgi:hypothetical protein